ncbi:MAG: GxxExxY protein [Syntrophobacteraceae bacterium]|nr:GxxExxY protein [Syntrophobacteraceae bacterium]
MSSPAPLYSPETHKHGDVTQKIIRIFYEVYNTLGHGFLEKVYENALALRLRKEGLNVVQQQAVTVYFDNVGVGDYFADLVVEDKVILELKAAAQLAAEHHAQLLNYLKATEYEVGLLLNFGPKPQVVRKAFDNNRKGMGR